MAPEKDYLGDKLRLVERARENAYWTKPLRGSFFNSHGLPDFLARFSTVLIRQV